MVREQIETLVEEVEEKRPNTLHAALVPTPTAEYRTLRKLMRAAAAPSTPPLPGPNPIPIPIPVLSGPRVLMWKQDPTVGEIGIRKTFLPRPVSTGPKDARINITIQGMPALSPNAMGDFIQTPLTREFDAVHTFAVVRQTLTLYQRAKAVGGTPAAIPWQWNGPANTEPIQVFPHHSQMMNAFYSRTQKTLAFGFFPKPGSPPPAPMIFTCRSLDIVAHECGHAVLDGLKPNWILSSAPPQTGALHESFGDVTAIFLALAQFDQVEGVIAQTKANLHIKTFLSDLAEEFGLALGRPNGLRNADNDLKLSQVSNEVHALSQVFTGAMYDVLADIFAFERRPALRDDAAVLHETAAYLLSLLIRGIAQAPANNATFADVANQMLILANGDGKPVQYRNFIRNRFTVREVVVSPVPLTELVKQDQPVGERLEPNRDWKFYDSPQDRRGCCGTMNLPENNGADEAMDKELDDLRKSLVAELEERKKSPAGKK
jgi:hypothetical protein